MNARFTLHMLIYSALMHVGLSVLALSHFGMLQLFSL